MIFRFPILLLLFLSPEIWAQNLAVDWKFPDSESNGKKISEILLEVERLNNISLAYAPSQFQDVPVSQVPLGMTDLVVYLEALFTDYKLTLKNPSPGKYIMALKVSAINLAGNVYDAETFDLIPGALIVDKIGKNATFANEKGFFFINIKPGNIELEIAMIGYEKYTVNLQQSTSGKINFYLKQNNELPLFVKSITQLYDPLTELLPRTDHIGKKSVFGEYDPLSEIKILPGVIPGREGQTGMVIRGGSPDQNLILIDGMPIYESSHIGNLSSVFLNETIRSIDFMKSGMPARYGGRLNSITNINLKEGNKTKSQNSLQLGLQGGTFFTEGPIYKEKVSYTLGFRNSWINAALGPFKSRISLFDDINIQYRDVVSKITYAISNDKKLTTSFYTGSDRLKLLKDNRVFSNSIVTEVNQFDGKNTLLSVNYDQTYSDKLKFNFQAGFLNYRVFSRGSYEYFINTQDTTASELDIINKSKVIDKQAGFNVDYYLNDNNKLRGGVNYVQHHYNPAVKQSISIVGDVIENIDDPDSAYQASEWNSYLEWNLNLFKKLKLIPGVFYANYSLEEYKTHSLQPRVQLLFDVSSKLTLHLAYSETTQFIHLLNTNGLGLPSELWVPSTSSLPAENLNHFNATAKFKPNEFHTFQVSWYTKTFDNLIEYIEPVDLFFNILGDNDSRPILNSQRDWNRKVENGTGTSNGFEFSYQMIKNRFVLWTSYHYGRSFRTFANQNNGLAFPSRYDYPHNINLGFNANVGKSWVIGAQWIYSSGKPFTIADIEITPPFEIIPIAQPSSKNNYRTPAFHTLNLSAEHHFSLKDIRATFNFGVYNVYNRLNTFYIYSIRTPDNGVSFKKVSLYPILPQLNFKFSW